MPLNPLIPLSRKPTTLFSDIVKIGKEKEAAEAKAKREEKKLSFEERKIKVQESEEQRKVLSERDTRRLGSIGRFSERDLIPKIESGDIAGAKASLENRIRQMDQDPDADSTESREALQLLETNPEELLSLAKESVKQARFRELIPDLPKGDRVNAQLPSGEIVPAIENEQGEFLSPTTGERMPEAIKAPTRQETGGPGSALTSSQRGKLETAEIEAEQGVRRSVGEIDQLIKLVANPEFIGGVAGDAVSLVNSAAAQVRQLVGEDSIIRDGQLDESRLDLSSENLSRFRKAAINNDRFDGAIMELAFIKAKTLNPDGKISDADVRGAERILNAGADKVSIIQMLRDNQDRAVRGFNTDQKVIAKRLNREFTPLSVEGIIGGEATGARRTAKDLAESMLKKEGLL